MSLRLNGSTSGYTELDAGAVAGNNALQLPNVSGTLERAIPGEVKWFAMNTAPSGYLKANGAAISRTTYASLFAAIGTTFGVGDGSTTFNLPDLRGEFVRGWADDRAVDTGRTFGTAQTDAMQGHVHNFSAMNSAASLGAGPGGNVFSGATIATTAPVTDGTNGTPRTAAETRPRNIALLACIRF